MIPDHLAWHSMKQSKQKQNLSAKGQVIKEVNASSRENIHITVFHFHHSYEANNEHFVCTK